MAENTRRSQRERSVKPAPKSKAKPKVLIYNADQGLSVISGNSYKLCIASQDIYEGFQSFPAITLIQAGSDVKYQRAKEEIIKSGDVLMPIDIKKDGKFFKITKKQLQEIKIKGNKQVTYKQTTIDGQESEDEEEKPKKKMPLKPSPTKKSSRSKPKNQLKEESEESEEEKITKIPEKSDSIDKVKKTGHTPESIDAKIITRAQILKNSGKKVAKKKYAALDETESESDAEPQAKTQPARHDTEDEEDFSEEEVKPKKRSSNAVKTQKIMKPKKKAKLPESYKKGKFNPAVKVIEFTKYLGDNSNQPFFDVSVNCNNKNLHRACATGNKALFKNIFKSSEKISSVCAV